MLLALQKGGKVLTEETEMVLEGIDSLVVFDEKLSNKEWRTNSSLAGNLVPQVPVNHQSDRLTPSHVIGERNVLDLTGSISS